MKNNFPAKLIALCLAALLWLYVNTQDDRQMEDIYSNVPVEVTGLAQHLTLAAEPPPVQVRVAGNRSVVTSLNRRDIRARVDLNGLGAGSVLAPVEVFVPGDLDVLSVRPAQVNLQIEQILEQRWPVVVKTQGRLAEGFVPGQPEVSPDFVFIHGSEQELAEIKEVFVEVELTGEMQEDLLLQLPVKVVNQAGQALTAQFRPVPRSVEVFLPVTRQPATKTLPVLVDLVGEVPAGLRVVQVIKRPEALSVTGPEQLLQGLEEIRLGQIELAGLAETTTVEFAVAPLLPEQVEAGEVDRVTVTVIIEALAAADA